LNKISYKSDKRNKSGEQIPTWMPVRHSFLFVLLTGQNSIGKHTTLICNV